MQDVANNQLRVDALGALTRSDEVVDDAPFPGILTWDGLDQTDW